MMLLVPSLKTLLPWCENHHSKILGVMSFSALLWLAPLFAKIISLIANNAVNSVQLSFVDEGSSRCHCKYDLMTQFDVNLFLKNRLRIVL
jgi:hypothetical protein